MSEFKILHRSKINCFFGTDLQGQIFLETPTSVSSFAHIKPKRIQDLNANVTNAIEKVISEPEYTHLFNIAVQSIDKKGFDNYRFELFKVDDCLFFLGCMNIDDDEFKEVHYSYLKRVHKELTLHIAHKLTAPLSNIQAIVSQLKECETLEQQREWFIKHEEQTNNLFNELKQLMHLL